MATLIADEPTALLEREIAEVDVEQYEMIADTTSAQHLLVARALKGDAAAFDDIFDQYSGLMLRTAYSIVKDRDLAEDAVQNALIQVWKHLPNLRETGALRPWLMRIVVNQCISFKRRIARSTAYLSQSFAEQETDLVSQLADDARGCMESYWDLAQAIGQLPEQQRMAIALHYYQGMTLPEMSQKLHISENTLKKRIQAALTNLRRVLRNAERDEAAFLPDTQSPDGW